MARGASAGIAEDRFEHLNSFPLWRVASDTARTTVFFSPVISGARSLASSL
jgi:hypothetical protein